MRPVFVEQPLVSPGVLNMTEALFTGINHNIDELLVGIFTQVSLRQGCSLARETSGVDKVGCWQQEAS